MADWSSYLDAEKDVVEIIACMDGVVVQIGTEVFHLDCDDYIDVPCERKKNPRFDAICRGTPSLAPEGIILGEVQWACSAGAKIELLYCIHSDDRGLAGAYVLDMVVE